MTGNHRWKTVLQYTVGVLILAVSVALAMLVPGWVANWQENRLLEHVTLKERDSIHFLDVDSLDIEGRLKMLKEAETVQLGEFGTEYYWGTEEAIWQRMEQELQEWCKAGLLPQYICDSIQMRYFEYLIRGSISVYVDQAVLPVYVGHFLIDGTEDQEPNALTVIMDVEKDILYYVSVSGYAVADGLAKEQGYSSLASMTELRMNGIEKAQEEIVDRLSSYDFASVCGAPVAEITGQAGMIEMTATLKFETFDGYAARRLMSSEQGFGVAVMYGTQRWQEIAGEIAKMYGFLEQAQTLDNWNLYTVGELGIYDSYEEKYNVLEENWAEMEGNN